MKKVIYLCIITIFISLTNYFNVYSQGTPLDNSMVTGFDVEELVSILLPGYKKVEGIHSRGLSSHSVYYNYIIETPEKKGFDIRVGVFKNVNEAASVFKKSYRILQLPPYLQDKTIGDEMYYSAGNTRQVMMRRQNVFIWFYLDEPIDKVLEIAREIDKEIQTGGRFVTRGNSANFPKITFEGVPAKIKKNEKAPIKIKIENVDPANVLIDDDYYEHHGNMGGVAIKRPDAITEAIYDAPETPGKKTIHISIATPENLITTETFTIEVE